MKKLLLLWGAVMLLGGRAFAAVIDTGGFTFLQEMGDKFSITEAVSLEEMDGYNFYDLNYTVSNNGDSLSDTYIFMFLIGVDDNVAFSALNEYAKVNWSAQLLTLSSDNLDNHQDLSSYLEEWGISSYDWVNEVYSLFNGYDYVYAANSNLVSYVDNRINVGVDVSYADAFLVPGASSSDFGIEYSIGSYDSPVMITTWAPFRQIIETHYGESDHAPQQNDVVPEPMSLSLLGLGLLGLGIRRKR